MMSLTRRGWIGSVVAFLVAPLATLREPAKVKVVQVWPEESWKSEPEIVQDPEVVCKNVKCFFSASVCPSVPSDLAQCLGCREVAPLDFRRWVGPGKWEVVKGSVGSPG